MGRKARLKRIVEFSSASCDGHHTSRLGDKELISFTWDREWSSLIARSWSIHNGISVIVEYEPRVRAGDCLRLADLSSTD